MRIFPSIEFRRCRLFRLGAGVAFAVAVALLPYWKWYCVRGARAADALPASCDEAFAAASALVETNADVIEGMPRHPRTGRVFDAVMYAYTAECALSEKEAALRIAVDFPNSNLGLFALLTWFEIGEDEEASRQKLWRIVRIARDSRAGKLALDLYLERAPDGLSTCRRVIDAFGGASVSWHAKERLAYERCRAGDHLAGIALYLDTYLHALEAAPRRLEPLRRNLVSAFVEAGLPYCASAAKNLTLSPCLLDRSEALRLRDFIAAMSERGAAHARLWQVRADPDALRELTAAFPESIVGARARLLCAARFLEAGDAPGFVEIMNRFFSDWESFDATAMEKAHLLLDACAYLQTNKDLLAALEGVACYAGCARKADTALRGLFRMVKTSEMREQGAAALLLRLARSYEPALRTREELEVISYFCESFPHLLDTAMLHTRSAELYRERWRAHALAAREAAAAVNAMTDKALIHENTFAQAHDLYMAEDFGAAVVCLDSLLEEDPSEALAERAFILKGLCLMRSGNAKAAAQFFRRFVATRPGSRDVQTVQFLEGYALFAGNGFVDAQRAFERFCSDHPGSALETRAGRILAGLARMNSKPDGLHQSESGGDRRPNVVLISLDTVRADHLGCYGYRRDTSPNMDAIARGGVLFTHVTSTCSWTKPSHASVFTGLYPSAHGAQGISAGIADSCVTLGQAFGGIGYQTLGIASAPPLHSSFGFDRGFDLYDDYTFELDRSLDVFMRRSPGLSGPMAWEAEGFTGSLVTDRAVALLDYVQDQANPFLLFINYFDPHHNYRPPWPHSAAFDEGLHPHLSGNVDLWVNNLAGFREAVTADDVAYLMALYDGEIRYTDEQIGRLVNALKERGQYDDTILVFFGDHGEEFLEHGGIMHDRTLYEEVVRVPLIMAGPGVPVGVRCDAPVSLTDILPTLLSLIGVEAPEGLQGRNVMSFAAPDAVYDDSALFAELDLPARRLQAVVQNRAKLIFNADTGACELYRLDADPGEADDLAGSAPRFERALKSELAGFNLRNAALRSGSKDVEGASPGMEDLKARLRALGYIGD